MKLLPGILALLTAIALNLPHHARAQDPPPGLEESYPLAWHRTEGAPAGDFNAFTAYSLTLYATRDGLEGPEMYALSLSGDPAQNDWQPIELKGLPSTFRFQAINSNAYTNHILAAGKVGSNLAVFRAPVTAKGVVGEWERIPLETEWIEDDFVRVLMDGVHAFILAERRTSGQVQLVGWAANIGYPVDKIEWYTIPSPPRAREGATFLLFEKHLVLAGGIFAGPTDDFTGQTASTCLGLQYEIPNFHAWEPIGIPISRRVGQAVGVSRGRTHFVLPRQPEPQADDTNTSMTLRFCNEYGRGQTSPWHEMTLAQTANDVKDVIIDPGHGWLLVVTRGDIPETASIHAYEVPLALLGSPKTIEEERLDELEKLVQRRAYRPLDEVMEAARESGHHALLVIGGNDRKQDISLRLQLTGPRFRYLAAKTQLAYFTQDEGAQLLQQYEITETPAYLLVTPGGDLVKTHTGTIADNQELFQLTSPTRQPSVE